MVTETKPKPVSFPVDACNAMHIRAKEGRLAGYRTLFVIGKHLSASLYERRPSACSFLHVWKIAQHNIILLPKSQPKNRKNRKFLEEFFKPAVQGKNGACPFLGAISPSAERGVCSIHAPHVAHSVHLSPRTRIPDYR